MYNNRALVIAIVAHYHGTMNVITYERPAHWISYDGSQLTQRLTDAKATVLSLSTIPYQRRWVDALQQIELKREVAGTSRIEGAEFTENELDAAMQETEAELFTRSQRQARAAVETYRWIPSVPMDQPINGALITEIHRRIVTGADDDHCVPGELRGHDQNVVFGSPYHRGVSGGSDCVQTFADFAHAIQHEYQGHDPLIQAIAAHYHLAAMHPFLDGNGRTARALEAMMLRRAGLRETSFLAMSNYYYDEKSEYLRTLAEVRHEGHDLTSFLLFALKGIAMQGQRLLAEIQREIQKELYQNLASDLYSRLRTPKRRVLADRQLAIIRILLGTEVTKWSELIERTASHYVTLRDPLRALVRDVNSLSALEAIWVNKVEEDDYEYLIEARLDWPQRMTDTDLFKKLQELPKAKTGSVLLHT